MNGQGPRMLGDSPTPPRLGMYLNVIPGWPKDWVRVLGTAVSFGVSLGSSAQSGVQRTTGGRGVRGGEGWDGKGNVAILATVWS